MVVLNHNVVDLTHVALYESLVNEEHLIISDQFACFICEETFETKELFDVHFQQEIPRDRKYDKTVHDLHLKQLNQIW